MEHLSQTAPITAITIGGKLHSIDLERIPYLKSYAHFQRAVTPDGPLIHDSIDLFDEALSGVERGFRQCFRQLEPDLSLFERLCNTYDMLCIDVCGGRSVTEIGTDLKSCRTDYELEYKRYRPIKGNKNKARDAAFMLLYTILSTELDETAQASNRFLGLILFVLSHRATFKLKTRCILWKAYDERFTISDKQRAQIEHWRKKDEGFEEGEDITTEESEDDSFDSDDW